MIRRDLRSSRFGRAARRPVLTIDDTTAHITADAEQAGELAARFRREHIACTLRRGEGVGGLDVLDFGNPPPAEERRIRAAFAAWQQSQPVPPQRRGAW